MMWVRLGRGICHGSSAVQGLTVIPSQCLGTEMEVIYVLGHFMVMFERSVSPEVVERIDIASSLSYLPVMRAIKMVQNWMSDMLWGFRGVEPAV